MIESARRRIAETIGEPIRSAACVSAGIAETRRTWRIIGASGRAFAVKELLRREPQTLAGRDALETEWEILSLLAEMGMSVPRPVAAHFDAGFLVSEWFDGETLDDLCQRDPASALSQAPDALNALADIERAFDARIADAEPFAYRQDYDAYLGPDFDQIAGEGRDAYLHLGERLGFGSGPAWESSVREAWNACLDAIRASVPTFGTLDYNARNLLMNGSQTAYIDFSTVGWDYPERRIVQYFVSLGSRNPGGNFVSALSRETVQRMGERLFFDPAALEAQYVLFLSLILARLLEAGTTLPADASPDHRALWNNRRVRFRRTLELFAEEPLADFPPTRILRAPFVRGWSG